MSTGTIMFCLGIISLIIALVTTIFVRIKAKKEREILEERLQKEY